MSESIATRGVASLVVAGGTTPQPIFNRLSSRHVDWAKVHVGLTDERWVAINTVVEEALVTDLVPKLSEAGARAIVEYPLNKILE